MRGRPGNEANIAPSLEQIHLLLILSPPPSDFLVDIRSLRQRYDNTVPILVHCSAGVGRSGVVVVMDMLMAKIDCGDVSHYSVELYSIGLRFKQDVCRMITLR